MASSDEQWIRIYETNKESLKKYEITGALKLRDYCENNIKKSLFFKSTGFYERTCTLNLGEFIKEEKGLEERTNFHYQHYLKNIKKKIKTSIQSEINSKEEWINWCESNKAKQYSNSTKYLKENVEKLCFIAKST